MLKNRLGVEEGERGHCQRRRLGAAGHFPTVDWKLDGLLGRHRGQAGQTSFEVHLPPHAKCRHVGTSSYVVRFSSSASIAAPNNSGGGWDMLLGIILGVVTELREGRD
jgi:hypothetical protein